MQNQSYLLQTQLQQYMPTAQSVVRNTHFLLAIIISVPIVDSIGQNNRPIAIVFGRPNARPMLLISVYL
jgi:hypothetical protein